MVTSASTSVLLSSAAISAVCCPVPPKTDRLTSIVCALHTTVMSVMNLYFLTTANSSQSASAAFVLILPSRESPASTQATGQMLSTLRYVESDL